ncbi:hypothetical protein ER308_07065 [Egibacter rhizosphaerae]|uniref:Pilus assembly protein n=1 Tax=Egibacter rhizosphaerae TaxID=1670831 RepID=A0A411YDS5_9ACTN|nr:hypothetical protein [Egibacter rhizosphaerae]QBI19326.1 hypothetical protein ER308_07065 [Egibacter rhizosphaerae]
MVLSSRSGDARRRVPRRDHRWAERGSQAVELALLLPVVVLLAVAVALSAVVGADVVAAQTLARDAARHAAVGDTAAAEQAVADAAPAPYELVVEPASPQPGQPVTARVRLQARVLPEPFGPAWLPEVEATMQVEEPP